MMSPRERAKFATVGLNDCKHGNLETDPIPDDCGFKHSCEDCVTEVIADAEREARADERRKVVDECTKVFARLAAGYHFAGMLVQEKQILDHIDTFRDLALADKETTP